MEKMRKGEEMKEHGIRGSEIRLLYALADKLGILERGNKEDNFHLLIKRETGKDSVKKLTRAEFFKIYQIMNGKNTEPTSKPSASIKKAWQLMYELSEISPKKSHNASVGNRMCGIIKKVLKVDAHEQDPFRFVDEKGVRTVIEEIKRYIKTEEKKGEK